MQREPRAKVTLGTATFLRSITTSILLWMLTSMVRAAPVDDALVGECGSTHDNWSKAANEGGSLSDSISVECGAFDGEYWGPDGGGESCVNVKVSNTGECRVDITYPNGSGGFQVPPGRSRARQTRIRSGQFVGYHCAVGDGNCRFTISVSGCVGTAEPLGKFIE